MRAGRTKGRTAKDDRQVNKKREQVGKKVRGRKDDEQLVRLIMNWKGETG